jgi:large subunit ribosomal protein L35
MPKMKTNKGAAKRLRVTGSGKIIHRKAWGSHYFKPKSKPRQMRLKGTDEVEKPDRKRARRLLGT